MTARGRATARGRGRPASASGGAAGGAGVARSRRPDRLGLAAAAATAALALAAWLWTATGRGYPFGPNDPFDDLSLLRALPAHVGAPLFAATFSVTALVMLGMALRLRPPRAGRVAALAAGWASAAVLLLVIPDLRLLALTAYLPMLILGAPFGWPEVDYGSALTPSMLYQGVSLLAGVMVAGAVLTWQRRVRGACASCGRADGSAAAARRWVTAGRLATYAAVVTPLLFALTRYAWMLGVPLGIGEEAMRYLQETDGRWRGGALATFAVVGAALTLGLVQRWGEVFPRRLPRVGGRPVPVRLAVVPAAVVALLIMSAGLGLLSNVDVLVDELGAEAWLVGFHALWPIWSLLLGLATWGYYLRRRGRCRSCDRP